MRLPNFPDRRIRYGSFFYRHKQTKIFEIFYGGGRSKPCAILYLLKDMVANPTPLNKVFIFRGWGEGRGNFVHSKNSFKT